MDTNGDKLQNGTKMVENGDFKRKENETKEVEDTLYGWGTFKPRWLQWMNNLPCFTSWSVFYIIAWGACNIGPAIPHLEKQFGLSSTRTAIMTSCLDIAGLSIMLFVSYIGTRFNKAKGVAIGAFVCAVGAFIETIPHWIADAPRFDVSDPTQNRSAAICPLSQVEQTNVTEAGPEVIADYTPYGIMILGELMRGFGTTSLFTLGTAYIDENGKYPVTAIFITVTYTATTVGGGLGSVVGGWIQQNVYVDVDRVDPSEIPKGPRDPNWIGAWWLIFLATGAISFISCIPLYGYPKYLPGFTPEDKEEDEEKKKEKKETDVDVQGKNVLEMMKNIVKDFFRAFLRLIRNLEFVLLSVATAVTTCAAIGIGMFSFKYLTEQYDLSFQVAGYIMASKAVCSGVGFIIGGLVIRKFSLHALGIERLSFALSVASAICSLGMLARCANLPLAGVEVPYQGETSNNGILSQCQGLCHCEGRPFDPVCGADDIVYYSACHAGCNGELQNSSEKIFTNCSCIDTSRAQTPDIPDSARAGRCELGCYGVYISTPFTFLMLFFTIISISNESIATLRCVDQDLRPFALGIQWIIMRLLGNIPSPIYLGTVLDSVCLVWSDPVPGKGTRYCQVYDKEKLAYGFCFMWMVANLVSGLLFFLSSLVNVRKKKKELAKKETEQDITDTRL